MLERILVLVLVALLVGAGWAVLRRRRAATLHRLRDVAPFGALVPPGRPAVVAFSSSGCVDCHARQTPALGRLGAALGERVTIRTLAADEHPELVAQLELLTVPATAVLDASGAVHAINLGYADETRLAAQLDEAGRRRD